MCIRDRLRVGPLDGDEYCPLVVLIIRPNAVNGRTRKGITVDKAAGIWFVVGIVLNDFTLKDTEEDFVKRKLVGLGLFVSVVCNS